MKMSSHGRTRSYDMGRPKDDISGYRDSPYSSKSRGDMDGRKRDSYSSRGDGGGMGERHREPPYASKPTRRNLDDYRAPYTSPGDKREGASYKRDREREEYSRGGRERDYPPHSRDDDNFHSWGGRDSFPPRGRGSFSRGSRDSSRGSFGTRGREMYSSRGSFNSRGTRPFSRGNYSTRGGREYFPFRGNRGASRGFRGSSHRGSNSDNFVSQMGPRAQMELTRKLVSSVLEESEGRSHYEDERPYRSKEFRREGRGYYHRDSDRHFKEGPRNFSHHSSSYIQEEKMIKRERLTSASHFDREKFRYSERSKLRMRDKIRGLPAKRMLDDDDFDLEEEPPVKHPRVSRRGRDRESSLEEFERRPSGEKRPPPRRTSKEKRKVEREGGSKGKAEGERPPKASEKRRPAKKTDSEEDEMEETIKYERKELLKEVKEDTKDEEIKEKEEDADNEDDNEDDEEEGRKLSSSRVKRRFSRREEDEDEEEEEDKYEKRRRPSRRGGDDTSSGGMQVTIRSDGERAVNREGHVKSRITGAKVYVNLQCPHCPSKGGQSSVSFKEYRFHLDSRGHRARIEKLALKHSVVLRRIRLQQRNEQRDMEEKWELDNSEEFSTTVSKYCNLCKLAFKCLPENNSVKGINEHNDSKLHKVQQRYLYPRCTMCRMSFPSRLVYEYHIASIRHLRMCRESYMEVPSKDEDARGEREEMDLTNFITMDSVGEDEELGSEQDEITGKLEDIEKAEEDAKEGEEEDEDEEPEERMKNEQKSSSPNHEERGEEDPFELDLEEEPLDHEIEDIPESADEENDMYGREYVIPIEAFYCKLCQKVIRVDTEMGEAAVDRHCRSARHIDEYNYLGSEDFLEGHGEPFDVDDLPKEEDEEECDRDMDKVEYVNDDPDGLSSPFHGEDDLDQEILLTGDENGEEGVEEDERQDLGSERSDDEEQPDENEVEEEDSNAPNAKRDEDASDK